MEGLVLVHFTHVGCETFMDNFEVKMGSICRILKHEDELFSIFKNMH